MNNEPGTYSLARLIGCARARILQSCEAAREDDHVKFADLQAPDGDGPVLCGCAKRRQ